MPEIRLKEADYKSENRIRNLLFEEQPREKLVDHGPDVLTDAELLAILIRSGSRKMNVVDTTRKLLSHFGSLSRLTRQDWQSLCDIPGMGKVKALTLVAAFELARRINSDFGEQEIKFTRPEHVNQFFGPRLRDLDKEVFVAAYLNSGKRLLGYDKLTIGGAQSTIVDVPEIFRKALLNKANGLIVVHNHPSGVKRPSQADIRITQKMVETGKTLDLPVHDHIIICGNDFYSFASEGML